MSGLTPNPTTPAYSDAEEWITAYFTIHSMSTNSRRYAWILWMLVGALFLLSVLIHWTGSHGGSLAAHWYKWAIRRRTWRGKHTMAAGRKYPIFLPPNGQLFCLAVLPTVALILAFVGPDYISPTIGLFDLPSSSLTARSTSVDQPQYSIYKAWWTSAGRNGIIAFALMPLCVLFAVKTPPFAIFALPFTTQTHFDKLAWLHRWSARLIWVITSLHSIMWSVQLSLDRRAGTGNIAYVYAWQYNKFIYGSVVRHFRHRAFMGLTVNTSGLCPYDPRHFAFRQTRTKGSLRGLLRTSCHPCAPHFGDVSSSPSSDLALVLGCTCHLDWRAQLAQHTVALHEWHFWRDIFVFADCES